MFGWDGKSELGTLNSQPDRKKAKEWEEKRSCRQVTIAGISGTINGNIYGGDFTGSTEIQDINKVSKRTIDDYFDSVTPPSQIRTSEYYHSYKRQRRPRQDLYKQDIRIKPFNPWGSDNEEDSNNDERDIRIEPSNPLGSDNEENNNEEFVDSESEDDSYDEIIKNPETISFDEYVGVTHNETDWTLKDGRKIIDELTKNTAELVKSISVKSKKERTACIMSVIRLGFSSIIDLSSEFHNGMYNWFGSEWDDIQEKVYNKVNMTPNFFEGETKTIVDTVEEYLFKIRTKKNTPIVQQIATVYFHVIDKFLDNPYLFIEETGKLKNLSEMEYVINIIAPILNDVFNDVLDILNLRWGETVSAVSERRRKIDLRIVHKCREIELSHTECAKAPTRAKAIRDRSKCLRTEKGVLDKFLKEDLSDETVKDSAILGLQFAGLEGQIIGVDLLDNGLYFGLQGPHFRFPAQLSNINCLRNALEALYFFKENVVRKANLFPDPKKYNHAYNKIFRNNLESKVKAKHFKTKFIRPTYFTPKGQGQASI
ncbi:7502_t:CDS:10 [Funneliformis geosporum]|uniref:7502_t:CDS:1 n=1 Tax=Funneliformis geosporum TaxID=1117311 RepID=A0A9W4SVC0_9GLOM|nr:7502_t:CDS:10 [Funneliformis geosporum]